MSDYDVWGVSEAAAEKAGRVFSMKHGMFAGVPIICKAEKCPYNTVCTVEEEYRVEGARCPMEAAAIVSRFEAWCRHFGIDTTGTIKDTDLADVSLIKDLVELEVQILRAENRIALNGDFVGLTIVEIDKLGKVYRENAVTPEAEFKLTLQEKKYKVLQLLNATRKDKVKELGSKDPSKEALSIFNKIKESLAEDLDNINFENEGDKENGNS